MRKLLEVDTDHLRTLLPVLNGQQPGIVRSPLVSHDPVLSIPLLHILNSENLRSIQSFKEESAGSPSI